MLTIPKSVLDGMIAWAIEGKPFEACGYLGARDGGVVRMFPMKNADQSTEHFSFDPAEQFETVRAMRAEGLTTAAVFHSHPNTPARMSEEDIRLARDPNICYIIVSLADREPIVKAFRLRESKVVPEDIVLANERNG
jgi:proteasome lid subunit RPN8/RPN11